VNRQLPMSFTIGVQSKLKNQSENGLLSLRGTKQFAFEVFFVSLSSVPLNGFAPLAVDKQKRKEDE
ncbi:MAG: hypothetical protein JWQ09_3812, partial [Segetibacter sp.]|nr:hypothetical protein [Segetibacter sp.]